MKNMRNLLISFLVIMLFSFISCSNLLGEIEQNKEKNNSNTYITIRINNISEEARTIDPDIDAALSRMQSINLFATKTANADDSSFSGTRRRLPDTNTSTGSLKVLYDQVLLLPDGPGKYKFELSGSVDGIYFYEQQTDILIEAAKANKITFNNLTPKKNSQNLTETGDGFDDVGGINIKLNYDSTNTTLNKVVVTVQDLSKAIDEEGYLVETKEITSSIEKYVQYKRSSSTGGWIATGTYRVTFDFYCTKINSTKIENGKSVDSTQTQLLNSLPYVVRVAKGLTSEFEDTIDLNDVYTITYKDNFGSNSGGLHEGQTKVFKYTHKSNKIVLPRIYRAYYAFQGWYTEQENGQFITNIPHGSTGNLTLYARWKDLGQGGTPAELYIKPDDEYHYGIEGCGLSSLNEAIEVIYRSTAIYHHDWTLKLQGTLTGTNSITDDNYTFMSYADSIKLEGIGGITNSIPTDHIDGAFESQTEDGVVLAVTTKNPVTLKNIKITGGNNNNEGDLKGGGIYVGSTATVILDDGILITNNTATTGSGIYCDGTLKIQGSAVVEGDIFLAEGKKLIISGPITSSTTTVAQITPAGYTEGTVVLEAASGSGVTLDETLVSKFKVTSQVEGGVTTKWAIDSNGKLYIDTASDSNLYVSASANPENADGTAAKPFATLSDALTKIETLDNSSAEYTIIVDGEIKSAESTTVDITKATSLIITGKSGNATNSLDAQLTGVPLIINTAVPVTVKNIKITKGSPYGIQLISGKLTLDENTLISENITGVYISGGEVIMTDGEISSNTADYGAGVYITYDDLNKTLGKFTMSGGTISGNTAQYGCGGGVLVDGTLYAEPEELAEYTGGDGDSHVLFTMSNGTISGNEENSTVTDDYEVGVGGGGVCVAGQYAKFVMSNSAVIKANTAPAYGAGVSVWNGAQFIMNGGTIGGSSPDDGNITGEEVEISTFGGGVYLGGDESSSFTMNNGTISNNKALGLGAKPFGYDTPSNCGGAGVGIFYGTFTMVNGNITSNNSKRHGGGIYIAGYGVFDMQGGSISENTCTDNGKGVNQNWTSSSGNTYKGQFKIKGDAVVASNNDVYLSDKLTITGSLNAANKVATLTPSFYDTSTIVLAIETEGGSVTLSDIGAPAKFLITPQVEDSVTTNWEIGSEGNLVKGSTTNNSGNGGIPEGFVTITGGTAATSTHIGTVENKTDEGFTTLTIPDLWVSSELVTQYEYEKLMTYYGTVKENTSLVPSETSETAKKSTPAYFVTWLDAIVYCNLRSEAEGLTPVYSLSDDNEISEEGSTWTDWGHVAKDENGKYYYNQIDLSDNTELSSYDLDASAFKFNLDATGYRLPTTAEYQNIVSKNPTLIAGTYNEWCQNYNYDYLRCWFKGSTKTPTTEDKYTCAREATLGFRVVRNAQ